MPRLAALLRGQEESFRQKADIAKPPASQHDPGGKAGDFEAFQAGCLSYTSDAVATSTSTSFAHTHLSFGAAWHYKVVVISLRYPHRTPSVHRPVQIGHTCGPGPDRGIDAVAAIEAAIEAAMLAHTRDSAG